MKVRTRKRWRNGVFVYVYCGCHPGTNGSATLPLHLSGWAFGGPS